MRRRDHEPSSPADDGAGAAGEPERPAGAHVAAATGPPAAPATPPPAGDGVPWGLRTAAGWSWRLIVVAAGVGLLFYAASRVTVVVVPVVVALLLSALLHPGAAALVRRGWPRALAALTMLLLALAAVAGILALVVNRFEADFAQLSEQVSEGIGRVESFVVDTFPVTRDQLSNAFSELQRRVQDNEGALASGALSTAATAGEVLTGGVLALFTLFFFLKDGRLLWLWLVGLAPRASRAYLDEAARRAWRTLVAYVRATVVVALVDAVSIGIGLAILRVDLVVPLTALVFLGAFIPIIGSFLAGSVAVLVALVTQGPVTALIALGIVLAVMQLEGHVLQPLLMGRAVQVHPLAVVLAISTGLLLAGIVGALIAVPTVACANVAFGYLSRRHQEPRPPEPHRPEPRPHRAREADG